MYELVKEQYAESGVDADKAVDRMNQVKINMHCRQTDDVGGFGKTDACRLFE